jgi:hypothetical protein
MIVCGFRVRHTSGQHKKGQGKMKRSTTLKVLVSGLVLAGSILVSGLSVSAAGSSPEYRCSYHAQAYVGGRPVYIMGKPLITARGCAMRRANGTIVTIGHDARFGGTTYNDGTIKVRLYNGSQVTGWAYQWTRIP